MKSWLCHFALQLNKHLNNSFSSIYSYSIYSRCGSAVTFSLTSNREQQKEQVQNHSMLCMLGLGHARRKTLQKLHCRSWPQNRSSHVKWGQKRVVWVRWRPFGLVVNTQGHLSRSVYSCKVEPLHAGNLLQRKEVLYYSRLYYLSKYLASLTTDNVSSLTFLATTLVTKAADVLKHQRFIIWVSVTVTLFGISHMHFYLSRSCYSNVWMSVTMIVNRWFPFLEFHMRC